MKNEPTRIAQIVGRMNGGGVEAVVMNYYRHIDHSKIQFDFLIDEDSTCVPEEEIKSYGGRIFRVPKRRDLIVGQGRLRKLFEQEKWTVVHSHINALSVFPLHAAKKAGVPVRIVHSHSENSAGFLRTSVK